MAAISGKRLPTLRQSSDDRPSLRTGRIAKLLFVNAPVDRRDLRRPIGFHVQRRHLWCRRERSSRPLSSQASARIFPGQITAQVTENIYDTPNWPRHPSDPQGARLIGVYDSQVRVRPIAGIVGGGPGLIMPNGRSIVLERQNRAADAGGLLRVLSDEVDNHLGRVVQGSAIIDRPSAFGAEAGVRCGYRKQYVHSSGATAFGAANSLNQTGQQVVRRNLNNSADAHDPVRIFQVRVVVKSRIGASKPYQGMKNDQA